MNTIPSSSPSPSPSSPCVTIGPNSFMPSVGNLNAGGDNSQKELRVYSRRPKPQKVELIPPDTEQKSEPSISSEVPGNSESNSLLTQLNSFEDLNLPIAVRKGTRSCTHHSIVDYVSYHKLSPSFKVFVSNLSSVEIPNDSTDLPISMTTNGAGDRNPIGGDRGVEALWAAVEETRQQVAQIRDMLVGANPNANNRPPVNRTRAEGFA
ncbi:hypothetical protein LWI29_026584 [Acer saccharum]|uniref:Uncharacterized protein n=1 Tax=Acer saccharum TaxID=4024 RepID=A0AA39RYX0_ACESA|nr:hypothetical protein LWI29_026584 [Acer saccharum]